MCLVDLKSGSLVFKQLLIVAKIFKALKLFIAEFSSAIAKKTILYYLSIKYYFLNLSYLIKFASLKFTYISAICLEIAVKKSFAISIPLILANLIALAL